MIQFRSLRLFFLFCFFGTLKQPTQPRTLRLNCFIIWFNRAKNRELGKWNITMTPKIGKMNIRVAKLVTIRKSEIYFMRHLFYWIFCYTNMSQYDSILQSLCKIIFFNKLHENSTDFCKLKCPGDKQFLFLLSSWRSDEVFHSNSL